MGTRPDREPRVTLADHAAEAERVSLVAHELRSPIAAVIGAARTLQERWPELSVEQRASLLALIVDETGWLGSLVEDVLDTSRIESGMFPYAFAAVDLGELARDTVGLIVLGRDEAGVTVRTADPIPLVRGDRRRLKQVLTNLIENAVKFSPPGSPVEVTAWAEAGRVLVSVEDHGPGIPAEQHAPIFEKFARGDPAGGKPGSGLGLYIARSIAEAHGGRLDVHSAPGQGATFTLVVPVGSG